VTKRFRKWNFEVARRDTLTKEVVAKDSITSYVSDLLEQIQKKFEKH
jgi:prolyl-tRNA synthetase